MNETTNHLSQPVLVVGGTGKTGSRVAHRLDELGVPIRIGSRNSTPAFDWQDRATWPGAVRGVRAAYISYAPDLAVPGSVEDMTAFVKTAADAGVEHLVLLSGRGEEESVACERVVQDSGLEWTVLRSSFFAQNFSEGFWRDELMATGELSLPVGDVREPFIDIDDIAEAAVRALTEDGHRNKLYELTGPRLLTFAEAVHEVSEASGRELRFRAVSAQEYADAMSAMELPAEVQSLLGYLFSTVLDGRNASVTAGVEQALGRSARDFGEYAKAAAATGAWDD